jgi:hypothetical protein
MRVGSQLPAVVLAGVLLGQLRQRVTDRGEVLDGLQPVRGQHQPVDFIRALATHHLEALLRQLGGYSFALLLGAEVQVVREPPGAKFLGGLLAHG